MFFIVFLVLNVVIQINGNCSPCPQIPKHYEELGCEGVFNQGDCCPSSFKCPDIVNYNTSECRYKGKSYQINDKLDKADEINCNFGCFCSEYHGPRARFTCASVDCPQTFLFGIECLMQDDLNGCCANRICDKAFVEKYRHIKCSFRGTDYSYGSQIYSDREPCYKCICGENFKNETNFSEQPGVCGKIDCGIELRSLDRLQDGCVPIYGSENSCCPFDYRCPSKDDKVIEQGRTLGASSDNLKCQYGNLTLNRYDSVELDTDCLTCICKEPPMIQCIKKPNCVYKGYL